MLITIICNSNVPCRITWWWHVMRSCDYHDLQWFAKIMISKWYRYDIIMTWGWPHNDLLRSRWRHHHVIIRFFSELTSSWFGVQKLINRIWIDLRKRSSKWFQSNFIVLWDWSRTYNGLTTYDSECLWFNLRKNCYNFQKFSKI